MEPSTSLYFCGEVFIEISRASFGDVARIPIDMGRIFYAWRGFLLIWGEFLRRGANSSKYGANFLRVARILLIWGGFLRRGANSNKYGVNLQRAARIHTDIGRIAAAWRGFRRRWGEFFLPEENFCNVL